MLRGTTPRRDMLVGCMVLFALSTPLVFGSGCGNSPPAAEYPEPAEKPIKVVLKLAGSEGGAYVIRAEIGQEGDIGEQWGTIFSLGKPDHKGVLGSNPTEYRFNMGDGVRTDSRGDPEWDHININIDKAGKWEGEMYAKLYVNGELVDCDNTDSDWAIRFVWSPPDGSLGFIGSLPCRMYPGF